MTQTTDNEIKWENTSVKNNTGYLYIILVNELNDIRMSWFPNSGINTYYESSFAISVTVVTVELMKAELWLRAPT